MSESKVKGVDDDRFRNDRGVNIIQGSINGVMAREGVSWDHFGIREDFPDDIKVLEKQGPVSLASRQFAGVFDIGEVFVVGDDGDEMGGSLDVLFPFLQCENDGKEFTIVDVIVSFSGNEGLGEIGTWVWVAIEIVLKKDGSGSKEGSIGHNGKGTGYIRDAKDRSGGKGGPESVEGSLLEGGPIPWLILLGQKVERSDNMGEVRDELTIEICKPEERVNAFDRGRGFPVVNSSQFDRVHHNVSLANDHAEEFHFRSIEKTFGEFQGETMFSEMKEYTLGAFMVKG